jgi:hypothetical protein
MKFPQSVSLSVTANTDEEFVTMFERLSRQCAGLLLDDIDARVLAYSIEDDES